MKTEQLLQLVQYQPSQTARNLASRKVVFRVLGKLYVCVFGLFAGHTGLLAAQQPSLKALVPNYTTQTLTEVPFGRITRIQEDTF